MIELIAIHIPKTGGISFRRALNEMYGSQLVRLYQGYKDHIDFIQIVQQHKNPLAIHGHFQGSVFKALYPDAKTVCWLRHPVDRIISYYYYWKKRRYRGNPNHGQFLSENWDVTQLATFLKDEVAGHYLSGLSPEQLDFIGILEKINEDMPRFREWATTHQLGTSLNKGTNYRSLIFNFLSRCRPYKAIPHSNKESTPRGGGIEFTPKRG